MKKLLYWGEPLIETYQGITQYTAILRKYNHALPWILADLANLNFVDDVENEKDRYWLDVGYPWYYGDNWLKCPYLFIITMELHGTNKDTFLNILINMLNNDNYIFIFINFTLLAIDSDANEHNTFLYGYDDQLKIFYACDFIKGRLKKFEIGFEEMYQAFIFCNYDKPLSFVQINKKACEKLHFTINMTWVQILIKKYMNIIPDEMDIYTFGKVIVYKGIDIYVPLIKSILDMNNNLDKRQFNALYANKIVWEHILNICWEHKIVSFECIEIIDNIKIKSQIICFLAIKYNIIQKKETRNRICILLKELYISEKNFFNDLLLYFEKNL